MPVSSQSHRNPWTWIPSLYFAEGLPYIVVQFVSVVLYKRMGISNADIALYTSWFYLPWVIKPLWSPFVDVLRTKRFWIVSTQFVLGAGLAAVGLTLPLPSYFQWSLVFFFLLAFSSATHDIAADGFYMLGLNQREQAWCNGIRSGFYRMAMIFGQGFLIMLAGFLEVQTGLEPVELEVKVQAGSVALPALDPDSWVEASAASEQRILARQATVVVGSDTHKAGAVADLLDSARRWNYEQGFTGEEPAASTGAEGRAGAVGFLWLRLAQPPAPDAEIAVNLDPDGGDKSITLIEGHRLAFTSKNWNRPALAVIQLDPRLRGDSAASFKASSGNIPLAWSVTFLVVAGLMLGLALYHRFWLPVPASDSEGRHAGESSLLAEFWKTFAVFFAKKHIVLFLAFLLLYRFAEAQLVKLAQPFMLDAPAQGGLGLTTGEVGFVYGTAGVLALLVGGILGGILVAMQGLRFWLPWMAVAINLPNAVYIYLSQVQPESFLAINVCVVIEQLGYGFGFTAYMLFMIYVAQGRYKTAHYAIMTGFMALGMMLPGMFSGMLQESLGYQSFFIWVLVATIPAFLVCAFAYRVIDPEFARKESA